MGQTTPEDFEEAREKMVMTQLMVPGVQKQSIMDGMLNLLREEFVPNEFKKIAYSAREILLPNDRFLLNPMDLGLILDRMDLNNIEKILIIADNPGYVTALLADIIPHVTTLDHVSSFKENMLQLIDTLELKNVTVFDHDILEGVPENAPFDAIFINGAIQKTPDNLFSQLSPEGRIYSFQKKQFISHAVSQFKSAETNEIQTELLFETSVSLLPEFSQKSPFAF